MQKKLAKEENVPGEDAKSVQNFSQSIFLYTKARLALWGSVPLDSMFYSDFDVKLLVWFVYIRLIFLIFWLILRSHRRSKACSPRLMNHMKYDSALAQHYIWLDLKNICYLLQANISIKSFKRQYELTDNYSRKVE